jgi:hypothetical protein
VSGDSPCTNGINIFCDDNCPDVPNPGQEDVDNDSTGNACDSDTIYGTVSGDVQVQGINNSL